MFWVSIVQEWSMEEQQEHTITTGWMDNTKQNCVYPSIQVHGEQVHTIVLQDSTNFIISKGNYNTPWGKYRHRIECEFKPHFQSNTEL